MKQVVLEFLGASRIIGIPTKGLMLFADHDRTRQISIPCALTFLEWYETIFRSTQSGKPGKLVEVLWKMLPEEETCNYEMWITGVFKGQYVVQLHNTATMDLYPVDTDEAFILVVGAHVPLKIDFLLMYSQSEDYRGIKDRTAVAVNVMSVDMLEKALQKAIDAEDYEVASQLRDELDKRKNSEK